ncbi:MAG TPA: PEP-CTERM sorting domain-containing protein [Lacunisphaera sp.]|nr:PEP-CTERM sorting domain-containing protein [Lacunisphaera sp.]
MNRPSIQPSKRALLRLAALFLSLPLLGVGQTAVTSWSLTNADATNSSAYGGYNFDNETNTISSITAGGYTRSISSTADNVFVRRAGTAASTGTTAGGANIWEVATSAGNLSGTNTSTKTIEDVLLGHNALMGANDVFTNTGGSPSQANNNIERIDYYWNGGFGAIADQGFAVFDRAASHDAADGFQIAVFTGWDSINNKPTAYSGNVVQVNAGATSKYSANSLDWDPTTGGTQSTFGYQILRFTNGDNLSPLSTADGYSTGQGIYGVYISFADLGIPQGTTIYGYSLMATDVTNTVANLVDWTSATYYPTNTSDSVGSVDFLGVNGRRYVPEPSTYGALLLASAGAALGLRRWRRSRLA